MEGHGTFQTFYISANFVEESVKMCQGSGILTLNGFGTVALLLPHFPYTDISVQGGL